MKIALRRHEVTKVVIIKANLFPLRPRFSVGFEYAPGAFDLFHVGHLNLLKHAKSRCDFLIAGVVSDEVLRSQKGVTPVIPLAERLEIVRNIRFVDNAVAAIVPDKLDIWRELRFDVFFKGDDWRGTEQGERLEREFAAVGVEVVYFPYTLSTSSTALRRALDNINRLADRQRAGSDVRAPQKSHDPYGTVAA
jgi:glycerol-3-phosphate cytidylyltransferase